eukprot:g15135.t1
MESPDELDELLELSSSDEEDGDEEECFPDDLQDRFFALAAARLSPLFSFRCDARDKGFGWLESKGTSRRSAELSAEEGASRAVGTPAARVGSQDKPAVADRAFVAARVAAPVDDEAQEGGADSDVVPPVLLPDGGDASPGEASSPSTRRLRGVNPDVAVTKAMDHGTAEVKSPRVSESRRVTPSVDAVHGVHHAEVLDGAVQRLVTFGPDMVASPAEENQGRAEALAAAAESAAIAGGGGRGRCSVKAIGERCGDAFQGASRGGPSARVEPVGTAHVPGARVVKAQPRTYIPTKPAWLTFCLTTLVVMGMSRGLDRAISPFGEDPLAVAVSPWLANGVAITKRQAGESNDDDGDESSGEGRGGRVMMAMTATTRAVVGVDVTVAR